MQIFSDKYYINHNLFQINFNAKIIEYLSESFHSLKYNKLGAF